MSKQIQDITNDASLTIRLSKKLKEQLGILAVRKGVRMSNMVRKCLARTCKPK